MKYFILVVSLLLPGCALTPEGNTKIDDVLCTVGLTKYCAKEAK